MNKYLDFVIRKPLAAISLVIVTSIILGSGIFNLEFDSTIESMMPKNDKEYKLNQEIKKIYGNNGEFIILCISSDDILQHDLLESINNLHNDIDEYKEFDEEKESGRLRKFNELYSSGKKLNFSNMIDHFSEDPVFQRYLARTVERLFGKIDFLSGEQLKKISREIQITMAVKKDEIVNMIISPFTARDLVGEDDALITYDLIEKDDFGNRKIPSTEEELKEFKNRLYNNPAFEKGIYVKNDKTGKITDFGMLIRLVDGIPEEPISKEIAYIAKGYKDLNILLQGVPVIYREINRYMRNDLSFFIPLVLLIVVIVFYLNFGSLRGVLLPFITLSLADLWILGLMGHLGYKLTVIGVSLPVLMIAVGSSYSIHIINQYYIDLDEIISQDKGKGLKSSMSHIITTVVLAGVTTFIGFIMLLTNSVSAIKEWGVFSAIGILFTVFISITLIPSIFVLLPHKMPKSFIGRKNEKKKSGNVVVDWVIRIFTSLVLNHSVSVIIVTVIILAAAIIGASRIQVETTILAYFKKGDPILTSSRIIGKKFGGSFGFNILIDSKKRDGIKDPELLRFIDRFREWLEAEENIDLNIGRSDSFTDFIKSMHLAMNNNDMKYYKIPDKRIDIESYIDIYSGDDDNDDGRIDEFEPYVDRYFQTVNILARIWEKQGEMISTSKMEHIDRRIRKYFIENLPEKYSFETSGEPKIFVQLGKYVVRGQIMSLLFSLLVVFIVAIFLFRSLGAGLLSLIPISVAVIINFGVMGWMGIRLDIATAIIASVSIGIGIDDTIHFLNTCRSFRRYNYSMDEIIIKTLSISGRAIVYTSLALVFGFLVFLISNFNPLVYFGFLVAITMVATTMGALLVLPATIKLTGISLSEPKPDSKIGKYLDPGRLFSKKIDEKKGA